MTPPRAEYFKQNLLFFNRDISFADRKLKCRFVAFCSKARSRFGQKLFACCGMFSANEEARFVYKERNSFEKEIMKITANVLMFLGLSTATAICDVTSQAFVWDVGVDNLKEIQLARVAEQKSNNPEVKRFAAEMIRDHSQANRRLDSIAQREGLSVPPTNTFTATTTAEYGSYTNWNNIWNKSSAGPDSENFKGAEELMLALHSPTNAEWLEVQKLENLPEPEFDRAYADQMVEDHSADIAKFEMATNMQNRALAQYATRLLPTLHQHYQMAQQLQSSVHGTGSQNGSNEATPPNSNLRKEVGSSQ